MLHRNSRRVNDVVRFTGSSTFPRQLALQPGTVQEFVTPGMTYSPIFGPDSLKIWFNCSPSLGVFDPSTQEIRTISTPAGSMEEILVGPDGNVWFGSVGVFSSGHFSGNGLGYSTPDGQVQFFGTAGWVVHLAYGSDRVWFTQEQGATGGGWVLTSDYSVHTFDTNLATVGPISTIGGAWFGEFGPHLAFVADDGQLLEYTTRAGAITLPLAFDPNGNLWYGTDVEIGYVNPGGQLVQIDIGGNGAFAVLFDGDGTVWFASSFGSQIGHMNPDGSNLVMYPISGLPSGLVFGSDGNPWFTEFTNRVGTIVNGEVREFPTSGAQAYPPILGADGNVWFSDSGDGSILTQTKIGYVTPSGTVSESDTVGIPNGLLSDGTWIYFGENALRFGRVLVITNNLT